MLYKLYTFTCSIKTWIKKISVIFSIYGSAPKFWKGMYIRWKICLCSQALYVHRVGWKKKWYSALTSDECPNPVLLGPALTVVVCCIQTSRSQGNLLKGIVNWSGVAFEKPKTVLLTTVSVTFLFNLQNPFPLSIQKVI